MKNIIDQAEESLTEAFSLYILYMLVAMLFSYTILINIVGYDYINNSDTINLLHIFISLHISAFIWLVVKMVHDFKGEITTLFVNIITILLISIFISFIIYYILGFSINIKEIIILYSVASISTSVLITLMYQYNGTINIFSIEEKTIDKLIKRIAIKISFLPIIIYFLFGIDNTIYSFLLIIHIIGMLIFYSKYWGYGFDNFNFQEEWSINNRYKLFIYYSIPVTAVIEPIIIGIILLIAIIVKAKT